MPELYNWNEIQFLSFALILLRVSAFVVSWPVFFGSTVPVQIKVLLALAISILLFPSVVVENPEKLGSNYVLIWLSLKEVFIGLTIGYISRIFFYIFNIAGDIISTSMGLSGVQLINPNFGGRSSAIEQFLAIIVTLFFIAINGHHLLLMGLVDSFRLIAITQSTINLESFEQTLGLLQTITIMGVKICAPVLVSLLIMNFTMAILGKAVPQINVLVTSLPINILLGFIVLFFSMPILLWQMEGFLETTVQQVFNLVKSY